VIKKIKVKNAVKEANLIRRSNRIPQKSEIVEKIINDVIRFGDSAILKYTKKYDKVKINSIRVEKAEIKRSYNEVTANQLNSLKKSKKLLEKNEKILLKRLTGIMSSEKGVTIKRVLKPIESVGCYIQVDERDILAL